MRILTRCLDVHFLKGRYHNDDSRDTSPSNHLFFPSINITSDNYGSVHPSSSWFCLFFVSSINSDYFLLVCIYIITSPRASFLTRNPVKRIIHLLKDSLICNFFWSAPRNDSGSALFLTISISPVSFNINRVNFVILSRWINIRSTSVTSKISTSVVRPSGIPIHIASQNRLFHTGTLTFHNVSLFAQISLRSRR